MNIRVFADAGEMDAAAAEWLTGVSADACAARGAFTIALSGGSTPRRLHTMLADPARPFRGRIDWSRWQLFWGDDRHVPPDHPDSNFRMAKETLIDRVPIAPTQVHRIHAELSDANEAAVGYEHELRGYFAGRPWPAFDLVLLGMGPDGHTASLFPGTGAVHESTRWVIAPWVEKLKTCRITLSPPAINAAAHVIVLVAGADKADALRDVLDGPRDPDRLPAQIVQPASGSLTWFVDASAASKLSSHQG
jgi:6-phosphogluconolactonase